MITSKDTRHVARHTDSVTTCSADCIILKAVPLVAEGCTRQFIGISACT